jgi:hypothetical protein
MMMVVTMSWCCFNEGSTKEQAKAAAEEVRKDALANVSN